jgi:hypothetical protein
MLFIYDEPVPTSQWDESGAGKIRAARFSLLLAGEAVLSL